jgi:chromosome segregation ATPase
MLDKRCRQHVQKLQEQDEVYYQFRDVTLRRDHLKIKYLELLQEHQQLKDQQQQLQMDFEKERREHKKNQQQQHKLDQQLQQQQVQLEQEKQRTAHLQQMQKQVQEHNQRLQAQNSHLQEYLRNMEQLCAERCAKSDENALLMDRAAQHVEHLVNTVMAVKVSVCDAERQVGQPRLPSQADHTARAADQSPSQSTRIRTRTTATPADEAGSLVKKSRGRLS